MSMEDAGEIHSEYTPRGWMKTERDLLIFEQHLYLRQPGYGTSYITGKYLIEETMAEVAKERERKGEPFTLKQFFDDLILFLYFFAKFEPSIDKKSSNQNSKLLDCCIIFPFRALLITS